MLATALAESRPTGDRTKRQLADKQGGSGSSGAGRRGSGTGCLNPDHGLGVATRLESPRFPPEFRFSLRPIPLPCSVPARPDYARPPSGCATILTPATSPPIQTERSLWQEAQRPVPRTQCPLP